LNPEPRTSNLEHRMGWAAGRVRLEAPTSRLRSACISPHARAFSPRCAGYARSWPPMAAYGHMWRGLLPLPAEHAEHADAAYAHLRRGLVPSNMETARPPSSDFGGTRRGRFHLRGALWRTGRPTKAGFGAHGSAFAQKLPPSPRSYGGTSRRDRVARPPGSVAGVVEIAEKYSGLFRGLPGFSRLFHHDRPVFPRFSPFFGCKPFSHEGLQTHVCSYGATGVCAGRGAERC
jgi:hypothetical protein